MRVNLDAERLIAGTLAGTFALYLIGGLYIAGPVLGWTLAAIIVRERRVYTLHGLVWVWLLGMAVMEIALLVAHVGLELPLTSIIKSSIGWAKGWALIALFIAAGCLLNNANVLWRGACHVGVMGLLITPILLLAGAVGLPEVLFVSPLKVIGGSGPEYFEVRLYEHDTGFGITRLRYFAPWGPAIGLIGNILFLMTLREKNARWRTLGALGCLTMVVLSLSRLGWLIIVAVPTALLMMRYARRPALWLYAAPAILTLSVIFPIILPSAEAAMEGLMSARADSTLVREWLADIALQRAIAEAPIWGHGIVEPGPHLVQFMPIGSHHSWLGLLFVKGVVGVLALAIPLLMTLGFLAVNAFRSDLARTAFGIALVLTLYTFGENLEILAYLYWPGLVVIGHALTTLGKSNEAHCSPD